MKFQRTYTRGNEEGFIFRGGLVTNTPTGLQDPGALVFCKNWETRVDGGYSTWEGQYVFDGRDDRLSTFSMAVMQYASVSTPQANGTVLTGATSGSTGTLVGSMTLDGVTVIIVNDQAGNFIQGETLNPGGYVLSIGGSVIFGVATATNEYSEAYWKGQEYYRGLIQKPTGSGGIVGGFVYQGDCYVFRPAGGGTVLNLFKSTSSGFQQIPFHTVIKYDAGTAAFSGSGTLTGGTSGATATFQGFQLSSGSFGSGNATGYVLVSSVTGTFQNNEIISGAGGSATIDGTASVITIPASGAKIRSIEWNFSGSAAAKYMYFTTGTSTAFFTDGGTIWPIYTLQNPDTPKFVAAANNRLWLGFDSDVQYGPVGSPVQTWSPLTGSSRIGIGEELTNMRTITGESVLILGRNKTNVVTGSPGVDLRNRTVSQESGALLDTCIVISGIPLYLDDRGIARLDATDAYGDFRGNTVSLEIDDMLSVVRRRAVCSDVSRTKSQYRIFYNQTLDDSGTSLDIGSRCLCLTMSGRKVAGFHILNLTGTSSKTVTSAWSGEDDDGNEINFVGYSNGDVEKIDYSKSSNGIELLCELRTAYYAYKSPGYRKAFNGLSLTGQGEGEIGIGLTFADSDQLESRQVDDNRLTGDITSKYQWITQTAVVPGGGGSVVVGFVTSKASARIRGRIAGKGDNASLTIRQSVLGTAPAILNAVNLRFTILGRMN